MTEVSDDIKPGFLLPALERGPVMRQTLVEWCAAENDYYPLHYDERIAQKMDLPGTPVQGTWQFALMSRMIERWMGGRGRLHEISVTYKAAALEGETLTSRGSVQSVIRQGAEDLVSVDVWIENNAGVRTAIGQATLSIRRG